MGRGRVIRNVPRDCVCAKLPDRTLEVLRHMISVARNGEVLLTADEIGRAFDFSRVTAHKHLRRLEDFGLVLPREWVVRTDGSRCVARIVQGGLHVGLHCPYIHKENTDSRLGSSYFPRCRAGETVAEGIEMQDTTSSFNALIEDLNATPPKKGVVDLAHMPKYPSPAVCKLISYPNQPVLPPQKTAAINMMKRAFRAVVHKHYGKTPKVDAKAYYRLEKVLPALRQRGVTNVWSWCSYRMTHWLAHDDKGKAPGIDWILNAPAVHKFYGAFKATSSRYEHVGKVSMTSAHRELLSRWTKLHESLRQIHPHDAQAVHEKREAILSDRKYAELRSLSEHQRGVEEARLYSLLARGKWIW